MTNHIFWCFLGQGAGGAAGDLDDAMRLGMDKVWKYSAHPNFLINITSPLSEDKVV